MDFSFPFEPYSIQRDLMTRLYSVLESSRHGIFESPTGTGKSLSIICGSLTWLRDAQAKVISDLELQIDQLNAKVEAESASSKAANQEDDEPDWMRDFEVVRDTKLELASCRTKLEGIQKYLEELEKFKEQAQRIERKANLGDQNKMIIEDQQKFDDLESIDLTLPSMDEDADVVIDEYASDDDSKPSRRNPRSQDEADPHPQRPLPQILFCSRTHSQLSQFIHELSKTVFASEVTSVAVASRASLCINEQVLRLRSNSSLINETCLEMINKQKKKIATDEDDEENKPKKKRRKLINQSCPYYNSGRVEKLRQLLLSKVSDIEDCVAKGKHLEACPYYATRFASHSAHVVALPYQTLLHRATRQAMGISLKDNVVIIDEAHNLLETLSAMNSVEITGRDFCTVHSQLSQYQKRFKARLKSKNLLYIRQLLLILTQCIQCLGGTVGKDPTEIPVAAASSELESPDGFMRKYGLDNVNLFKLLVYIEKSEICRKLNGYLEKYPNDDLKSDKAVPSRDSVAAVENFFTALKHAKAGNQKQKISETTESTFEEVYPKVSKSRMYQIRNFLQSLLNETSVESRVLIKKCDNVASSSIKVFILNPASYFEDVVKECRSVVLAGGTMQPMEEFTNQLFFALGVGQSEVETFSCGHVVSSSQIQTYIVGTGPTGKPLNFSFKNRQDGQLFVELGQALVNIIRTIRGGCVVFFPSYEMERQAYDAMQKQGILSKIEAKKRVFKEPKTTMECEAVFEKYKRECDEKGAGAVLLAIMGGKMSEGINFSDDYGRCVVVVGMPYPNVKSPQLKEKMAFLSRLQAGLGHTHYENLCMKAVNQSIGRAIRHQQDFATVVLLDERFARPATRAKLPHWMADSVTVPPNFGSLLSGLAAFFRQRK